MLEKMVFEKILTEYSLQDIAGREFWVKYFLTQVSLALANLPDIKLKRTLLLRAKLNGLSSGPV